MIKSLQWFSFISFYYVRAEISELFRALKEVHIHSDLSSN